MRQVFRSQSAQDESEQSKLWNMKRWGPIFPSSCPRRGSPGFPIRLPPRLPFPIHTLGGTLIGQDWGDWISPQEGQEGERQKGRKGGTSGITYVNSTVLREGSRERGKGDALGVWGQCGEEPQTGGSEHAILSWVEPPPMFFEGLW